MKKTPESKGQRGGRRPNQTGRPKGTVKDPTEKAKTISFSVSADIYAALAERAEKQGVLVTEIVRTVVKKSLKKP